MTKYPITDDSELLKGLVQCYVTVADRIAQQYAELSTKIVACIFIGAVLYFLYKAVKTIRKKMQRAK